jgi:hypothetical protein
MKTFIVKIGLLLPLSLFVFYLSMILVGCIAGFLHCTHDFYCGPFCLIGKILGGFTVFLFFFSILPDIKAFINIQKYATPEKKQKN